MHTEALHSCAHSPSQLHAGRGDGAYLRGEGGEGGGHGGGGGGEGGKGSWITFHCRLFKLMEDSAVLTWLRSIR